MEENDIILKPIYKSKKDIINRIPYINTENDDISNLLTKNINIYPIPKKYKNLTRKNLTYQNFLDFTYDFNSINENKIKMPDHLKIKQKYELLENKVHTPFSPPKRTKKIAPLLITGLNTPNNKKYSKIFSSSRKSFENSEVKTKSSSHKFTKSNFFNYNSSNSNNILYPSEISKSNIHFHGNLDKFTKNENKDEGLKAFVLKSKLILKEKIIKQELADKLNYHNELHVEGINALNKKKEQLLKNLKLFDIFGKVYVHYIRELIQEEMQERRFYNLLKNQKIELENEITKILKKIERVKIELSKYESLKNFFKFSKSGLESLINKEKKGNEENGNIQKTEEKTTNEKKERVSPNQIKDFQKNLFIALNKKLLSYRHRKPNEKSQSQKKNNYLSKYNSLKPSPKKLELNPINEKEKEKEKEKQVESKKGKAHRRKSKRKSSMLVHQTQYDYIFTKVENSILKNIEVSDNQRNQIFEEKKDLEETKKYFNKQNKYINEVLEEKENILSRLKEENYKLKMKFISFSKKTFEENLSQNKLEQKMLEIILNIHSKINIQEILKSKNILYMLKLKSQDFLERYKKTKIIFLIKTIELIISYLVSKKNKYLSEPKLREQLKNFLYVLENDKKIRMNKLNKEMLQKKLENKKTRALDKATKIRFFSYRKFDLTHYKSRKNKDRKEQIYNKTTADEMYQQWISYE